MTEIKGTTPAFVGALDHELFDDHPQELRYLSLAALVDEALSFSLEWNCLGFSPSTVMVEAASIAGRRVAWDAPIALAQVILQQEIIKICENKWIALADAAVKETGILDPATAMESISQDDDFSLLVDKLDACLLARGN
jgi:hypothetical protein